MTRSFVAAAGIVMLVLGLACDDPTPDLAEWTVADHKHQSEKSQAKRRSPAPNKPAAYTPPSNRNMLVEVTWTKQCENCHGRRGRGDGPQSPMVKAKDLTSVEWQATVTDEQLGETIRKGKGKMPSFNLPDSMVAGLVAHIRMLGQKVKKGFPQGVSGVGGASGAAPAAGASPAAGATPSAAAAPAPAPAPAPAAEEDEEETESENAH